MKAKKDIILATHIIDASKISGIAISSESEKEVFIVIDGQIFDLDEEESGELLLAIYHKEYFYEKLPEKFINIIRNLDEKIIYEYTKRYDAHHHSDNDIEGDDDDYDDMPF